MKAGIASRLKFYSITGVLNLAVGVMFYTINMTPIPEYAAPTPSVPPVKAAVKPIPATVGTPVRVVLPTLALDLPVAVGSYNPDDASWTVDTTSAYYADVSMPINNSNGVTLIYGHAQSTVFETLPQIGPDAEAIVYTDTSHVFHYQLTTSKEVLPTDVSVFSAEGPPTLVLQTCVGAYSELRALFYFKLVSVEKL